MRKGRGVREIEEMKECERDRKEAGVCERFRGRGMCERWRVRVKQIQKGRRGERVIKQWEGCEGD